MNDGLVDALRHNTWATRELLATCRGLSDDQLRATAVGTYGSIIDTLWHITKSEAGYCARLTGEPFAWNQRTEAPPSIDQLMSYVDDLNARWEQFLTEPFDAEQTVIVAWDDAVDRDVPRGVFLAQAIHHGSEHRAQVATILTMIGVEPPEWGVWDYAEATGRARQRGTFSAPQRKS